MNNKTIRIILLVSIVLLASTMILPLWDIAIFAPQYPEGLALQIWLNKISGDLNNINILNHYVGMKAITPSDIPELVYFPKLIAGILVIGAVALAWPHLVSIGLYFLSFAVFSLFALYDFWKWEYDYGHNLSPDAPIKVPGMSYQPPLIGSETLLNISIYSYPAIGGWLMMVSFLAVLSVLYFRAKELWR